MSVAADHSTIGPIGNGEAAVFRVKHRPPDSAMIGEADVVTVTANDQGSPNSASLGLTTSIARYAVTSGPHAPDIRMDHAVIADPSDPQFLWAIGGYDDAGPLGGSSVGGEASTALPAVGSVSPESTVNRYRPRFQSWNQLTGDVFPIPFPGDHAFGLNVSGEAIVAAFPDATGLSDSLLHIFNLGQWWEGWTRAPLPTGFPQDGIWAHDISCDLSFNICYLTGGASTPGGGDLTTVYAYDIQTNTISLLPPFTSPRAHHASFLVDGLLCIAGGIDATDTALDSTQCYDITAGIWRPENTDLGPLPGTLWGMADAVMEIDGELRPVLAAGIYNGGPPGTHFLWHDGMAWQYDDPFEFGVYRAEADAIGSDLFLVGGSTAGITPSNLLQTLHWCPTEPPPYRDCSSAVEVSYNDCVVLTNALAGNSGPPLPTCGNFEGGDVWIRAVVPDTAIDPAVTAVGVTGLTDIGLSYYEECPHQNEAQCVDSDFAEIYLPRDQGGTYWIRAWETGNDRFGEIEICVVETWVPVELLNITVE
jgi:hypothetical protein